MEDLFKPLGPGQPIEKPKAIIAIDPGTSGCIVTMINGAAGSLKMPETPTDIFDHLLDISKQYDCVCYLEKVQGLPGNGGSSMFNFGKGYGHLEMALIALKIRTITVTPQKWQKFISIGTKGKSSTTEWKNKLKARAQQLFPNTKVVLWNADALLIAEYAKSIEK